MQKTCAAIGTREKNKKQHNFFLVETGTLKPHETQASVITPG